MTERRFRAQILLDPEQHRRLAAIARDEGRSISELVREIIDAQLNAREQSGDMRRHRQLKALEDISRHRTSVLERHRGQLLDVDVIELLDQLRDERDAENLGYRELP